MISSVVFYPKKGVSLYSKGRISIFKMGVSHSLKGRGPKKFSGGLPPDPHPFLHPHFATAGAAAERNPNENPITLGNSQDLGIKSQVLQHCEQEKVPGMSTINNGRQHREHQLNIMPFQHTKYSFRNRGNGNRAIKFDSEGEIVKPQVVKMHHRKADEPQPAQTTLPWICG